MEISWVLLGLAWQGVAGRVGDQTMDDEGDDLLARGIRVAVRELTAIGRDQLKKWTRGEVASGGVRDHVRDEGERDVGAQHTRSPSSLEGGGELLEVVLIEARRDLR